MKSPILSTITLLVLALTWLSPHVNAALLFTNEEDTTDAHTFVIDFDEDAQNEITLRFGASADLRFDKSADQFEIDNDLSLEGNELRDFRVQNDDDVENDVSLDYGQYSHTGALAYDYGEQALKMYTGTGWVDVSGAGGSGGGGSAAGFGLFVGLTNETYTGSFETLTENGYMAANELCTNTAGLEGSHVCQASEIIATINQEDPSTAFSGLNGATAWMAEGAPGFTSNSNDCSGWQFGENENLAGNKFYGSTWVFGTDTGGSGILVSCGSKQPIACCGTN